MKNSTWDNFIKPIVVLFTICLVVSGALAFTNGITAPIIERNAALAADAARIELLPTATDGFEKMDVEMDGVQEMYRAKNGTGYTVTSAAKGYGGDVKWMVAFDTEGTIVGAKVLEQSETAGLGAKVEEAWFQEQFVGKTEELTTSNFDMISGATISSKATMNALNIARKAFMQYGLGVEVVEKGVEVTFVDDTYTAAVEGYAGPVTVSVTFNADGTVADVTAKGEAMEDTSPAGLALPKLIDAVKEAGNADVDSIAGVTFTSDGFIGAAKAIFDAYKNGTAVAAETTENVADDAEETEEPVDEVKAEIEGALVGESTGFMDSPIKVSVVLAEDGSIADIIVEKGDMEDTSPVGEALPDMIERAKTVGSADIEGLAGATFTSNGFKTALAAALENK